MNITKITKKSGNKYELIIDNKKHIVYDDVLLKYHILKPGELSKETYDELLKECFKEEVYSKILKFITFKMRSEKEVREKLYTLTTSGDLIEEILTRLRNDNYLNNTKYIESFINDELNLTLYGPNKIKSNLLKKGFTNNTIDKYLENIDFKVWSSRCDKLITKRLKTLKNGSNKAILGKLRLELINNGYEDKYFSNILKNTYINEEESFNKEYNKIKKQLEQKYTGIELEYKIKQKLYSKGYDVSKL